MILEYKEGGGAFGTPKSDYITYVRPLNEKFVGGGKQRSAHLDQRDHKTSLTQPPKTVICQD